MVAEINFTGTITVSPDDMLPIEKSIETVADMSGVNYVHNKQLVPGNVTTALDMGSVTTPGVAWFKNCDATNFIDIRNGSAGALFLHILPGEVWPVRLEPTVAPYALADTGAVLLEYMIAAQ
jgi:hypothetical protein